MVILQFNKLIRNKWVWGVFAIAISLFFAFDFLIDDIGRSSDGGVGGEAGTLAGEAVKAADFTAIAEDIRGIGNNRDWKRPTHEVNRAAWETLAMISVAEKNGIVATDEEVRNAIRNDRSFAVNGQFSFALYERLLRENKIRPEYFEAYLKRQLTLSRVAQAMVGSAAWVSPLELKRSLADMTDTFTVRVAEFKQTKEEADKVKLDDAGLRKWYDENTNSIALPERIKVRLVKFDATDPKIQAKMSVSTDEIQDLYDATVDKYKKTDTNGVEVTQKFEEVRDKVEKEARRIAAVQYFETNLNRRAYAGVAKKGVSRLDTIAGEDGLKIETSDWFTLDGGFVSGFMQSASSVCPGASGFNEAVAELDPSSEDLRYAVVSSERAVWLIEKAETSAAHVPGFAEAKEIIRPRALKAAQLDAFKAAVNAVAAKGTNAVCSTKNVSTNITFSVCDMKRGEFPNQGAVVSAARKLAPGEVSEFTSIGGNSAILVVCVDRKEGDAAQATLLESQIRDSAAQILHGSLPEAWRKANLDRMGFEPTDISSVTPVEEVE